MGQAVICARVARHLANQWYKSDPAEEIGPALAATLAAAHLPHDYPGMLRFALHSLAVYLNLGMSSQDWLENVLQEAHLGASFRRVFFFAYKENRSPYPRVTNRGVQNSSQAHHSRVKKGKLNA